MSPKDGFLILGNGDSGTSLLRGLLNAHSQIDCMFEWFGVRDKGSYKEDINYWISEARKCNKLWGNKVPYEQFLDLQWPYEVLLELIDHFKIVFIQRRFSRQNKAKALGNNTNWQRMNKKLYFDMRERDPYNIVLVSFEDLLIRTDIELARVCCFLAVPYEESMIENGTRETGHKKYNYGAILEEKI